MSKNIFFTAFLLFMGTIGLSQKASDFDRLSFRFIGPEGNRAIAIAGVPGDPMVNYIGAASGGLWKTTDGGISWRSIFDDNGVCYSIDYTVINNLFYV